VQPLSRILVGVDFSDAAFDAFECALTLSARHNAELVVVHAVPHDEPFSWHARARTALHEQLRLRAARAHVAFEERVQSGDPAEIVLLHARALRPDLIVVGTHQRRGFDRLRLGSVAARVAAKATAAVLLVPRHRQTKATQPFRHVAVAVDFSAASERAVEHALALAASPGDRITLVHVVPGATAGPRHTSCDAGHEQHRLIDVARERLHAVVPPERTVAVIEVRVRGGQPAAEIRRAIEDIGADLLVVGTRKRGLVSRALFGTTASQLLKTVPVPMLTVPDNADASARKQGTVMRRAA
jgi:nucleotide-binding universal stress UspA family protein